MAWVINVWTADFSKLFADLGDPELLQVPLNAALLKMPDRRSGPSGNRRWQRGGKDEATRKAANEITQRG